MCRGPQTKKDSIKHEAYTSKNDEGWSTWSRNSLLFDKDNNRGVTPLDDEDHPHIGSPSHDPMTTWDPRRRDPLVRITQIVHHP